jgi:hypothetical protein
MSGGIQRHPLLQKYCDARRGMRCTREHTLSQNAIIKGSNINSNTPKAFTVNVLRIARDNKINSQAVVDVLGWMLEAGCISLIGPRHYTFSDEFKNLAAY